MEPPRDGAAVRWDENECDVVGAVMRFLIVPGNNSLSHIFKALSVTDALRVRGHEVAIGIAGNRAEFLARLGYEHHILPDLQETDGTGFPTIEWFKHPQHVEHCLRTEADLIRAVRPDRVLGIFRFTLKASCQLSGVPFDSLACGCVMPEVQEVLGFAPGEPGIEDQKVILGAFHRYAGKKVSHALSLLGLDPVADVRQLLKGERTFLWDFPEFMPMAPAPDLLHIGPLRSTHMPRDRVDVHALAQGDRPLAIVGFGTCMSAPAVAERLTRILTSLGYHVVVAAGALPEMGHVLPDHPRVTVCRFAPMDELLPHARLLVTHGGQMTVFEALQQSVPALVMPFQPEQAHNGVCLERIGCGCRLVPPIPFGGDSSGYVNALAAMTDGQIAAKIDGLVGREDTRRHLERIRRVMDNYHGVEALVSVLERG